MLPDWVFQYVGGSALIVVAYLIVSNTLWLIFGARILQALPGVNIKGATGTLRIIVMLAASFIGISWWLLKKPLMIMQFVKKQRLSDSIAWQIQSASRLLSKPLQRVK